MPKPSQDVGILASWIRCAGVATAGLCYLTNSFANFLSPEFAAHLSPYILIPGMVEIVLALRLFVMGVNVQRWKEQTSAAGVRA